MNQGIFMRKMEADGKEAVIDVVGVIGWEVWYPAMKEMLKAIPATVERVIFDIYSPGGDVWEGNGIVQEIGAMKQETVARVQVAASMATLIAVACKTREIAANGRWLIHNPWTQVAGDAASLEKRAKELRDCELEAAAFYAARTGQPVEKIIDLMSEERWLTPAETKELGFVQSINDPFKPEEYADVKAEIEKAGKWPKALVEIPKSAIDATCPKCGHKFDYCVEPEKGMGFVACPKCGADVTQADCDENKNKGKQNGNAIATGTASEVVAPVVSAVQPADEKHEVSFNAGVAAGRAEGEKARAAELESFASQLIGRDELIKQHQSAKDKAESHTKAVQAEYDEKIVGLNNKFADITAKHEAKIAELGKQAEVIAADFRSKIEGLTKSLKDANERNSKLLGGGMAFEPAPCETWEEAMQICKGDYAEAAKKYDKDRKLRNAYNEKHKRN